MREYDFTLNFMLRDAQTDPSVYVEKLYEGGCDDALIGTGNKGYIALNFIREASSANEAISSAIADVRTVLPDASLIAAAPDFVGLTDAAEILGCTRQNIRKLIVTDDPSSPLPVYRGTPSIWHLAEILTWLREAKGYSFDDGLLEVARTSMAVNLARSLGKVEPKFQEDLRALIA